MKKHNVNHLNCFNYRHPAIKIVGRRNSIAYLLISVVLLALLGSCGMSTSCGMSKGHSGAKAANYR